MNLQLFYQMTTALDLTTSHGSRVARMIRSSYPATKALVKSGSRKQPRLQVFRKCIHVGGDVKDDRDMVFLVPDES